MRKLTLVILACLPMLCPAQDARLQKDVVFEGDIATLVIEHASRFPSLYAIDTRALEKDFVVLDVEPQTSRVSGSQEDQHRMQWRIQLVPRRIGRLEIPSIRVGDKLTPQVTLEVEPLPDPIRARQTVAVEMEAIPQNPYPGQQVTITMRLIHQEPLFEGAWVDPEFDGALSIVDQVEKVFASIREGRRFHVLERTVALFAESPGYLNGSLAGFSALVLTPQGTETQFKTRYRRIFRHSKSPQLEVRDVPEQFTGEFWLPARRIAVSQSWNGTDGLRVGDTLDIQLTIVAWGLPGDALPSGLLANDSDRFKVYPDQETRSARFEGKTLVGRLDQSYAVVLTGAGEMILPDIRLTWWDVEDEVEKQAVAKGKRIIVAAPPAAKEQPDVGAATSQPFSSPVGDENQASTGIYLYLIVMSSIATAVLVFFWWRSDAAAGLRSAVANYDARRLVRRACLTNDPIEARQAVIRWGREQWPASTINGLREIEAQAQSAEFITELCVLDAALYSSRPNRWRGERLWSYLAVERAMTPTPEANPSPIRYFEYRFD